MKRQRDDDPQRAERLIGEIADGIAPPTDAELRRHARDAAVPREPQPRPAPGGRPWRPVRFRWALAVAGLLLLATGLGFGVGAQLTPSSSAHPDETGLGFLPAKGWTILQAGTTGAAASASAVAANVPLDPADRVGETPVHTLGSLPRDGVVIAVTLTTRGDAAADRLHPIRTQPLHFTDARVESDVGELVASERRLTRYRLQAGVGGYNVDAHIVFGGRPPSRSALDAADEQLRRLVVSPDQVTMAVRPTIAVGFRPVTVYGSVANGRAGQKVTVQFRQCGLLPVQYRDTAEVTTNDGGGWTVDLGVDAGGAFRAVAGAATSGEVPVQKRADVRLSPTRFGDYLVSVVASISFWHRHVVLQRYDRKRGKWLKVKTLLLKESNGAGVMVWSDTKSFSLKLPKGTPIRATMSLAEAKPCYLAGVSNILNT